MNVTLTDYTAIAQAPSASSPAPARARDKFIGFARDEASASILHEALGPHLTGNSQVHMVDFPAALNILAGMTTPEIILIDLSGQDQPINAMMELAEVVEVGTTVIAIGEIANVSFYRTLTKGMGVKDYLPKPLLREKVENAFVPIVANDPSLIIGPRGGRLVSISGARGGVGASTLATNLAWFIGTAQHRHTILLDADMQTGTVGLNLNIEPIPSIGTALETPERVDHLLIERSIQHAGERLHILAGQDALDKNFSHKPGSGLILSQVLRSRYNFVIADTGAKFTPLPREILHAAQQRVIVLDPSLIAIRNTEKLLSLPAGPAQAPRPMMILNMSGKPGGMSQSYMEQAIGVRFDAVIPYLPRVVPKSNMLGTPAAALRGPFRNAIHTLADALGATSLAEAA
jgi:pilus assembly protein CpaE